MITAVAGVEVGHWTDPVGLTGCTVVVLPEGTVASGEVRGGAPGSRELDLLAPERLVDRVDAVVLAGGSAFGLAACDGVMRWCEERGRGFSTAAGHVPIVVGLVVFDLATGDARARPGPEQGYAAASAASSADPGRGRVGAGTGATYAKWRGREAALPGGIGGAVERDGDLVVGALVVVNAVGGLRPATGDGAPPAAPAAGSPFESTTIGVVATNAALDKVGCLLVAQSAHDGLARALEPAHTRFDGDAFVAAATGEVGVESVETVRLLAARAVEAAIRTAVTDGGKAADRP